MTTVTEKLIDLAAAVGSDVKALFSRVLPAGGTAGQLLAKASGSDYATAWIDAPASGSAPDTFAPAVRLGFATNGFSTAAGAVFPVSSLTVPTQDGGSPWSRTRRGILSADYSGGAALAYEATRLLFGAEGYRVSFRFGLESGDASTITHIVAGVTLGVGASYTANVAIDQQQDVFAVCSRAGFPNLAVVHSDESGDPAAFIDLGADFPAPVAATDIYHVTLQVLAGVGTYTVRRVNTGAEVTGTVTTRLPLPASQVSARIYSRGAGMSDHAIALMALTIDLPA